MKHQIRKALSVLLAVLLFAGVFSGCGKKEAGVIRIATKPMTEQFILSEMLAQLIEQDTDLTVEITKGIGGGTTNIHPALLKGDFDLYPEYTGTAWAFVVKREDVPDDDALYAGLQEAYGELGLKWTGLYGFNNTFALAVRRRGGAVRHRDLLRHRGGLSQPRLRREPRLLREGGRLPPPRRGLRYELQIHLRHRHRAQIQGA